MKENVTSRVLFVSVIVIRSWLSLCLVLSCLVRFENSKHAGFMLWNYFVQIVGIWNLCKKWGDTLINLSFVILVLLPYSFFLQNNGNRVSVFCSVAIRFYTIAAHWCAGKLFPLNTSLLCQILVSLRNSLMLLKSNSRNNVDNSKNIYTD